MRRWIAVMVALAVTAPSSGLAQADGWRDVKLEELKGSSEYQYRETGVDFLSAEGDFDGDGRADKAVLVRNDGTGKAAVSVRLASGRRVLVGETDLAELPKMGVGMVSEGMYGTECTKPAPGCRRGNLDLKRDAVNVFRFNAASEYFHWNGDGFAGFVISD